MRNISERIETIFLTFRVFSQCNLGLTGKNVENRRCQFSGRGGKEIFKTPYISPNFELRELKIYTPLEVHGPHLCSELRD